MTRAVGTPTFHAAAYHRTRVTGTRGDVSCASATCNRHYGRDTRSAAGVAQLEKFIVRAEAAHITADENIAIKIIGQPSAPSPVSDPEAAAFRRLHRTIRSVFPEAIVAPYVVVATTDARQYTALSPNVYRFLPTLMDQEAIESLHGSNERLAVANYPKMVQFYATLIRNSQ